jgi:hypothetical protein
MSLIEVIYASRPVGYDEAGLASILGVSRRRNEENDITGALICRDDLYLQLLEGPAAAVDATYARIERDRRHVDVRLLGRRPVATRLFPGWAMRDDPARSWMWTREAVAHGAIARAAGAEAVAIFERLSREMLTAPLPLGARLLAWLARKR